MIKYKHYKTKDIYTILYDDILNVDTEERWVVYKSDLTGKIFIREYNEFFEILLINNIEVYRFQIISNNEETNPYLTKDTHSDYILKQTSEMINETLVLCDELKKELEDNFNLAQDIQSNKVLDNFSKTIDKIIDKYEDKYENK